MHFLLQSSTSVHIPVFFHFQFCSQFLYSHNFLPNVWIPHNYSSSNSPFCPHPWHMGCIKWTLPSAVESTLLPYSFSLSLLSEQILLEPAVGKLPVFLAKLEAMAFVTVVPCYCSTLELVLHYLSALSISFLLSCSLSNSYLKLWPNYTIVQLS